ncbi:sialidase family protein [Paraburkholderia sp. SIMBA_049]
MPLTLVNMTPASLSGDIGRDSEPNVSVNPANPLQIAASTLSSDPAASGNAPIFVSTDGGTTWAMNIVLPGGSKTNDSSLRFATTSSVLYAGILRGDTGALNILRTASFTSAGVLDPLVSRAADDQPWVEAATAMGGAGNGADHVYVANNDTSVSGATATVDQSLDASTSPAPAGFVTRRIEVRATSGQDGPPVRTSTHPDGTVYGVFLGWRAFVAGGPITSDVVVVRDDDWGAGATPYRDLVDAGDGQAGVRVAAGVTLPPFASLLGTQRTGASACIAVDPSNRNTVYVAWIDGSTGASVSIHLRRSTDAGQTWSADLRTIATATNPCLAVDVRGQVGFMYQQLGNPGSGNRWRTHFEVSSDGFASAPTDLTLADVPDANGTYTGVNPIGDYANLTAVGKTFYGIFSANNTPDSANFPNSVTYQRNANFVTHTLLANDGVTTVAPSIDPFFFRYSDLAPGDDFYVRDWTDSATSGDTGLEPSTHAVFYATSDVWNRRGSLPGTFMSDQPPNEDAGNGVGNIGDNWAFARVRRNAAGTGSTTVTAHFLVSKLGTGSNYVDAGTMDPDVSFPDPDPTLVFGAADLGPTITPAYRWHLGAVSSTHLCQAVEISTPADPFVPPSLLGRAPGWPTTDLAVINDNNKAQRNMGLSTTPARGEGLIDSFALVHNAATFHRDMVLRGYTPPKWRRRLAEARLALAGEREQAFESDMMLTVRGMAPGENRWLRVSLAPPGGAQGEVLAVFFDELVAGKAVNGFGIGAHIGTDKDVARALLERHRSVFTRLAAMIVSDTAQMMAHRAAELCGGKPLTLKAAMSFVAREFEAMTALVARQAEASRNDPFELARALKVVHGALGGGRPENVAIAYASLLERLDSSLTSHQLAKGDPADVVQNVRWQAELYARSPRLRQLECAREICESSQAYVRACGERRAGLRDYANVIQSQLSCFAQTADALGTKGLKEIVDKIPAQLDDLASLQHLHRRFLLAIDDRRRRRS